MSESQKAEQSKVKFKQNQMQIKQYFQQTRFYMARTENMRKGEVKDGDVQVCNVG